MTVSKPSFPARSDSLRTQLTRGNQWPEAFGRDLATDLRDLSFDRDLLLNLASAEKGAGSFIICMLSNEYLPLGVEWARCARKAGIHRFALAAVDSTTADTLASLDIPHVMVDVSPIVRKLDGYEVSGFNSTGVAILLSRIALVKYLVDNQIDVTTCDVDALLLRSPDPYLSQEVDISFQKVAYHPKPLSAIWGLAACCGYMSYRGSARVSAFLDHVIAMQQDIAADDQLIFNLALFENGVRWSPEMDYSGTEDDRRLTFAAHASDHVYGRLEGWNITLEALPANLFWRHHFIPLDLDTAVLVHPNSPQSLEGKLEVFRQILGQDLQLFQS